MVLSFRWRSVAGVVLCVLGAPACGSSSDATSHPGSGGSGGAAIDSGSLASGGEQAGGGGAVVDSAGGGTGDVGGGGVSGAAGSSGGVTSRSSGGAGGAASAGGSAGRTMGGGGKCSFTTAPAKASLPDPNAPPLAQATAIAFHALDILIGRYLRGDVTVYGGTGAAHDNESQLVNDIAAGPYPDGNIPQGSVIASLDVRAATRNDFNPSTNTPTGNTAVLVMHGLPPAQHVVLEQPDSLNGLTEVGTLSGIATTTGLVTSCMNCAPAFAARPATLTLDVTATGTVSVFKGYAGSGGKNVDVTAHVDVSGNLTKTPPCALTFEDLVVLDSATGPNEIDRTLESFTRDGGEMVWQTGGQFPAGSSGTCELVQNYTIEITVDLSDLGHWGTRNFKLAQPTCVPPTP